MISLLVEFAIRAALIATGTAVVLWAMRIKTAAALHTAWTCVLIAMLLLPMWTAWGPKAAIQVLPPVPAPEAVVAMPAAEVFPLTPQTGTRQADATPSAASEAIARTQGWNWQTLLLAVYVLIACTLLARLAIGTVRARMLVRGAIRRDDALTSAACAAPITVGLLRPVAILPEYWHEWTQAQL